MLEQLRHRSIHHVSKWFGINSHVQHRSCQQQGPAATGQWLERFETPQLDWRTLRFPLLLLAVALDGLTDALIDGERFGAGRRV